MITALTALGCVLVAQNGSAADVLTQHNDQWRTGANTTETVLTPANVNQAQFGKLFSYNVDGYVYAQPLYVSGVNIGGGQHNVLYVATMEDSVYAFDADTNKTYWHVPLNPSGYKPVPIADAAKGYNNKNIHGDVGVLSTPVIDKGTSTIYLLARTKKTSDSSYHQALHALDLVTGQEKFGGPTEIAPAGFNTLTQNQRPGLALANGNVYVCWGSHEDYTPYNGWMMSFDASTLALKKVFNTTPGGSKGALWQAGQAPAVDSNGRLYVTTGNGDWNGSTQWGETCLKLSPDLAVEDWFTPANYASMNQGDTDFGAAGCMLMPAAGGYPDTSYVVTGGKEGKLFSLDKNGGLGHEASGDANAHQIWQAIVNRNGYSHHIHGTPVYWESGTQGKAIYVWGENDYVRAYKFDGTNFNTTASSKGAVYAPTTGNGMPGATLALSSNGKTNGIIWANCVYTGDALHDIVPGVLRAYDANDLTKELWNSYQNNARDGLGSLAKYTPPTVANGKVYMATFSDAVCVYGALSASAPPVADGTYKIVNRNSGLALGEVIPAATDKNQTIYIDQETYAGAADQKWTVTSLGNGTCKIINVGNGQALDVEGASAAAGTRIDTYAYKGQTNQQWTIATTATMEYYTIQGVQSGLPLDVAQASNQAGGKVQQWTSNNGNNQQWSFQAP